LHEDPCIYVYSLAMNPYSDTDFVLCEVRAVVEETLVLNETVFSVRYELKQKYHSLDNLQASSIEVWEISMLNFTAKRISTVADCKSIFKMLLSR